jgi:acyl-CoA thioester hydrolase
MEDESVVHKDIWFKCKLRVRYQETDQMGVVYHANYLNWFELGRTEFIRELGFPYHEIEKHGLLLPVTEAEMKLKHPAYYDDVVLIYVRLLEFSHIRMQFEVEVRRDPLDNGDMAERGLLASGLAPNGELLVKGTTKHVWVNRQWKPTRLDKAMPEIYTMLQDL